MKELEVKAVVLKPNEKPYVTKLKNELKTYQKIVDGLIDIVSLDDEIDIIVNDEGLLMQLKPNIMNPYDDNNSFLVGNCIFVSHDEEGNCKSLSREQISRVMEKIEELRYKLIKYTYEYMKRKYEKGGN